MKKEYKKILVNGEKIQAQNDGFKDSEIFANKFYKELKKQNYDMQNITIKYEDGNIREVDYEGVCDTIASKNLPIVYLNTSNNICIKNDYATYELIR